jgi:hypothetical protein
MTALQRKRPRLNAAYFGANMSANRIAVETTRDVPSVVRELSRRLTLGGTMTLEALSESRTSHVVFGGDLIGG